MQWVRIGVLAKQANVGAGTLRYYESVGLLAPARRSTSGYRLYGKAEIKRLRFIARAQELGFALSEIAVLLRLNEDSSAKAADVKRLIQEKLEDIEQRIADLERMKQGLQMLAKKCGGRGTVKDCPILGALNAGPEPEREGLS